MRSRSHAYITSFDNCLKGVEGVLSDQPDVAIVIVNRHYFYTCI